MTYYDIIRDRIKNDDCFRDVISLIIKNTSAYDEFKLDDHHNIQDINNRSLLYFLRHVTSFARNEDDFYWLYLVANMQKRDIRYIYEWKHIEEFVKGLEYEDKLLEIFRNNSNLYVGNTIPRPYKDYKAFDISSAVYMGTKGCFEIEGNEEYEDIIKFYIANNRDFNDFDV